MTKICTLCNQEKLLEDFCKDNRKISGRGADCKQCKNERTRKYRKDGRDKDYWKRPEVIAKKKEWNKLDYINNKEKHKERNQAWISSNYERHRKYQTAYTASYRAYKKQATPSWASEKEIFEFYKNCPEGMEVDHIIPLNHPDVCGLHEPRNFQYLSRSENAIKNNQWDGTYENETWRKDLKKTTK